MVDIIYAAAIGCIAGLIPVYLGLLPLPLFRRLPVSKRTFLTAFSIGILLFLFIDVTGEAAELSKQADYGFLLFTAGLVMGLGIPILISSKRYRNSDRSSYASGSSVSPMAYIISVAIGLHNLGEGLAIGSAYASGQLTLTTVLVIGFALHNGTEGMAISVPASDMPVHARELAIMGFLAGFPTVIGSIAGSLFYSSFAGAFFFSTAAGALLFVVVELLKKAQSPRSTFAGLLVGILLMYFTELLLSI